MKFIKFYHSLLKLLYKGNKFCIQSCTFQRLMSCKFYTFLNLCIISLSFLFKCRISQKFLSDIIITESVIEVIFNVFFSFDSSLKAITSTWKKYYQNLTKFEIKNGFKIVWDINESLYNSIHGVKVCFDISLQHWVVALCGRMRSRSCIMNWIS